LDKAKSLLEVTAGKNFLDFTADQIKCQRELYKTKKLGFLLMNSFSTEADTKKAPSKKGAKKAPRVKWSKYKLGAPFL